MHKWFSKNFISLWKSGCYILVQLPLRRTRRHRADHISVHFHTTSVMMPHAPPAVVPLPILRPDWEILVQLASRRSKPLDLDVCPMSNHPPIRFLAQPTNRSMLGFEAQTKKPTLWFCGPNHQTRAASFEAQTGKPSPFILRLNQETRAPHLHVHDADHTWHRPITRPPSTRTMLDHPWSSAPSLLLLPWSSSLPAMSHLPPTHYETRNRDSPH
jgi:anaerobic selenocysteine-containing dehydrogenase